MRNIIIMVACWALLYFVFRSMIRIGPAVGPCMEPVIHNGNWVVASPLLHQYNEGDIVVFRYEGVNLTKRIAHIDGDQLYMLGDNAADSFDSRHFGWVDQDDIIAKVIHIID